MGYVFISYSHGDQLYVRRLVDHLRAHGVESWFDYRLVPGDAFGSRIQEAIEDCDAFLVVLTPGSAGSTWVRREIVYADSKRKPVLPLLLSDCNKPIELITLHHEDVRGGHMTSKVFLDRLRDIVSSPSMTNSADPTAPPRLAAEAQRALQILNPGLKIHMPRPARTRIVCVANQKGGVGKSTTVVNMAVLLALHGNRVLVIDLDPQGHTSSGLDVAHHASVPDVYDCPITETPISEVVQQVAGIPSLWCMPATADLNGAEIELASMAARESRLQRAVESHDGDYDYIFIDSPPSLGLLTVNALAASSEVMTPIQCEFYAVEAVQQLVNTIGLVRQHLNPGLELTTVLLTMYDRRTRLADAVEQDVRLYFGDKVLKTVIPREVSVSEATAYGQSVISYDPGSAAATSYFKAAHELATRAW